MAAIAFQLPIDHVASPRHLYFHPRHGLIQVKQGFCWPAFVFGTLWALTTRVYPLFFIMMAVEFALWLITGYAAAQGSQWLELLGLTGTLAYTFIRGMRGNRWVQSFLLSRGYVRHGSDAGA